MKRELLIFACTIAAIYALYSKHYPKRVPTAAREQKVTALPAPAEINDFREPVKFEYLDSMTKKRLLDATLQTCVASYHRESCVYYLLVCGETCKVLLAPEAFARAQQDYWALAKEAGIKRE